MPRFILGGAALQRCGKIHPTNKREGVDFSCNSHDLDPAHHAVGPGRHNQPVAGTLSVIAFEAILLFSKKGYAL
jgi:hypothetical protein